MGGSKFRLCRKKNYSKRKRKLAAAAATAAEDLPEELTVALPISAVLDGTVDSVTTLASRLTLTNKVPPLWIVQEEGNLLVLQRARETGLPVDISVSIQMELSWTVTVGHQVLQSSSFKQFPDKLSSVSCLLQLLSFLSTAKLCKGNTEEIYLELWKDRLSTLHGLSVQHIASVDEVSVVGQSSLRHMDCHRLLRGRMERCEECIKLRDMLKKQIKRRQSADSTDSNIVHDNHRFKSVSTLVDQVKEVQHKCRLLSKCFDRLKDKIANEAEKSEMIVDEELHDDLVKIAKESTDEVTKELPEDSFQRIFWEQQLEAASKKNRRSMRWHPLMIRWCLYIRHRSSGAYEAIRSSGCIELPSQRTLRDYTHFVQSKAGFSHEVDAMLMKSAKIDTCPEREKYVLLVLDEMHIREGIVYDKHSREAIGFADLGDINEHLREFEHRVKTGEKLTPTPAETMLVFMVRGLFNSLQFPYAQFPAADLSGELLYDPFWEAVVKIEHIGLKVMGTTLDGNAVNRKLLTLHGDVDKKVDKEGDSDDDDNDDVGADVLYKTVNPCDDSRDFYFFSDPPHLIKTARNSWSSKKRNVTLFMYSAMEGTFRGAT